MILFQKIHISLELVHNLQIVVKELGIIGNTRILNMNACKSKVVMPEKYVRAKFRLH